MKEFFSRALFYKENKAHIQLMPMLISILLYEFVWKFSLLIGLVSFIQKDQFINYLNQGKYISESQYIIILVSDYFMQRHNSGIGILFYIFLFGISAIRYDRIADNSLDIYAMPFKRKTIIGTKWITTTIIFITSMILILIIMLTMCGVYSKVISGYFNYLDVCRFIFVYSLTGILVISVAMLGQCITRNMFVGGFVSLLLLYFDKIILLLIMYASIVFLSFGKFIDKYLIEVNTITKYSALINFAIINEENLLIKSLILIILTITVCMISIYLYDNAQVYIEGRIFITNAFEKFANVFIYGYIILLFMSLAIVYINPKSNNGRYITTVVGLTIGILIIKKLKEKVWSRFL